MDKQTDTEISVERLSRREFLIRLGGATAAITVVGGVVGTVLSRANSREDAVPGTVQSDAGASAAPSDSEYPVPALPNADDPLQPAPGTRAEYTPINEHYRIDLNLTPPDIIEEEWRLEISGLVDSPLALSLADLRENYEPVHQFVTLACISNPVGGSLTSTTMWTGTPLMQVLEDAGLQSGSERLIIRGVDDFDEVLELSLLGEDERIMLTYAMDGEILKRRHGFPLRIYIPDLYGMKQPKWITSIEVTDELAEGYWVRRGWDAIARIRTTAVVDTVAEDDTFERDGQVFVPIGGMAHAGVRGISKVEVQVDGGEWVEADLRSPISEATWNLWRYDFPFSEGMHTFAVRTYDSAGVLQVTEDSSASPDGATGIHSKSAYL